MLKTIYTIVLFLTGLALTQSCAERKEPSVVLTLEGKTYEKLWLRMEYLTLKKPYSNGVNPVTLAYELEGISTNGGSSWSFIIPDSVRDIAINDSYAIKTHEFDFISDKESLMAFSFKDNDVAIGEIELDGETISIEGKYIKTIVDDRLKDNENFSYILTDTFVMAPVFEYDVFEISSVTKGSSIDLFLSFPEFSKLPETNYSEELQKRIEYVARHPNSGYLFNRVLRSEGYKSKQDMKLVFDHFSSDLKTTEAGVHFEEYLSTVVIPCSLDTLTLLNPATAIKERVITNKKKHTLVIFSASWCAPCHEQIPILKDLYKNLSKKVDMLYITIDGKSSLDQWSELTHKERIPWRSLIAGEQYKNLKEYYAITGIPHSILIYPDGREEVIDVRLKKNRDTLYKLIN